MKIYMTMEIYLNAHLCHKPGLWFDNHVLVDKTEPLLWKTRFLVDKLGSCFHKQGFWSINNDNQLIVLVMIEKLVFALKNLVFGLIN